MRIKVLQGTGPAAFDQVLSQLDDVQDASFVSMHANADLPIRSCSAQVAFLGATSCQGVMTGDGAHIAAAAFVIEDPDGAYGTGLRPLGDDPEKAAQDATRAALTMADRLGEKPDMVWLAATPGAEEAVLAGVEAIVGADVPIIGGSAADNTVSGDWSVFDGSDQMKSGVAVAVMFPSGPISFAYQNGYSPTERSGTVTAVEGRRVAQIDGRPATEVYGDWTNAAVRIAPEAGDAQPILAASTLWPLGREVADVGGVPYYLLAHPAAADPSDGGLHLFADVEEGEVLTQMTGSADSLVARAGRVTKFALNAGDFAPQDVAGALMIYCGGCMLSVQERIGEVAETVGATLENAPFLGAFTFGEQGPILGTGNRHGNLMISCIIFGR